MLKPFWTQNTYQLEAGLFITPVRNFCSSWTYHPHSQARQSSCWLELDNISLQRAFVCIARAVSNIGQVCRQTPPWIFLMQLPRMDEGNRMPAGSGFPVTEYTCAWLRTPASACGLPDSCEDYQRGFVAKPIHGTIWRPLGHTSSLLTP